MTRRDASCLAAIGVVLIVADLVLISDSMPLTLPVALLATAFVIAAARHAGLRRDGFGLAESTVRTGLAWAGWSALAVVVAVTLFAVTPWSSGLLDDDKTPQNSVAVLAAALIVIPLRTVLLEEVAFRGALWGLVERRLGPASATAWSSLAFGLWHVPDAVRLARENAAFESAVGSSGLALGLLIVAVVVVTGAGGVVFCELRRRSGSLLAPIGLHWALNATTLIAGAVVT